MFLLLGAHLLASLAKYRGSPYNVSLIHVLRVRVGSFQGGIGKLLARFCWLIISFFVFLFLSNFIYYFFCFFEFSWFFWNFSQIFKKIMNLFQIHDFYWIREHLLNPWTFLKFMNFFQIHKKNIIHELLEFVNLFWNHDFFFKFINFFRSPNRFFQIRDFFSN